MNSKGDKNNSGSSILCIKYHQNHNFSSKLSIYIKIRQKDCINLD